ncbi:MotA/TolQ/ExbB proton channel family protein [candidate division KSB1 bacterium]|nr:MotA/TolQ/ExbB proton channel family protein [candidate division KSB1 bacterium]NIR71731.1 MotA/TolQ/ExbB proton channel family protein [candidate division KSB1 bacterium]NIS26412.1 MotA/TolQ/ExbB proton channel family protein [candidate division KSB1 bacterium]NIT73171.1 MotA/TolQ/ExbB proton channel family protein [candidate division KSB1 bacterium]NIU27098.1 MotA/TolQ/ExbB proton channel family protein [candidate division KSB1 bacterium]
MEYINLAFQNGGPFMYVIFATLVIGIAIIVERFIFVTVKNRIDTPKFVNKVVELIQQGSVSSAVELCNMSRAALPVITKAGLIKYGKDPKEVQNAFELAAMSEIPKLEKRTHYLAMIANVATLLGLLGTIIGLIQSFEAVASADSSQKAALLSAGISVAMNTTAFGLVVAIPCMVFHSYIQSKTNALVDEINENVTRIYQKIVKPKG